MHLIEGELIEEIEKLDEGWWAGVGDNGAKRGLFPGRFKSEILRGLFYTFSTSQLRGRDGTNGWRRTPTRA